MIVKKYGFSLTNLMGTAGPDKFVTDLAVLLEEHSTLGHCRSALLHFRWTAGHGGVGTQVHH